MGNAARPRSMENTTANMEYLYPTVLNSYGNFIFFV